MDCTLSKSKLSKLVGGYQTRAMFYVYWVGRRQEAYRHGAEVDTRKCHLDFCKVFGIDPSDFSSSTAYKAVQRGDETYRGE